MTFKIQILNGFKMYFDQITSVFKSRYDTDKDINLDKLSELTGLNRRKARLILNYLADIGLSEKRTLNRTEIGRVIYEYDDFLEKEGTLWIMHYLQSTNDYLVIWNRIMNNLFDNEYLEREEIIRVFEDLKDKVSQYTFSHHIGKETSILIDAYINQRFSRLNIIEEDENRYRINRNLDVPDIIFLAATVYFKEANYPGATAIDIKEVCEAHNSPGRIFVLDDFIIREKLEGLKNQGLISIESRGDLDQIRFKEGITFEDVLVSYYVNR